MVYASFVEYLTHKFSYFVCFASEVICSRVLPDKQKRCFRLHKLCQKLPTSVSGSDMGLLIIGLTSTTV